jgi:hypothetical protein
MNEHEQHEQHGNAPTTTAGINLAAAVENERRERGGPVTEVAVAVLPGGTVDVVCDECDQHGQIARIARGDETGIGYCEVCGKEWHPTDDDYPQTWVEVVR